LSRRALIPGILVVLLSLIQAPAVQASVAAPQIATVAYPVGIAQDADGNVFIAKGNGSSQGVVVVPATTGTLFGEVVTAGSEQLLFSLTAAMGVAVNSAGDLFVNTSGGNLWVVTRTRKAVFNNPDVLPNTPTQLFTGVAMAGGMEFDSAGNLFGGRSSGGGVVVLPATTSGPIFGQSMMPNTINPLNDFLGGSDPDWTADVAFDNAGNLYITQMFDGTEPAGVYVVPTAATTSLYGVSVTNNAINPLVQYPSFGTRHPCGISIDSNDTIFYVSWIQKTVYAMPTTTRTVLDQSIPADSFTRLTGANGYADQGVLAELDMNIITGGPSATYQLISAASYTVTFDPNSLAATGSMTPQVSSSATNLTANSFELAGFTFAGWATSPTGALAYMDGAIYPFTSSTTLHARWAGPGEVIPVLVRTPPPDVYQSVSVPGDSDCSSADNPDLNWAGTTNGGWGKSWAQWPNEGTGGFVCNRVLRYSLETERWFTLMQ